MGKNEGGDPSPIGSSRCQSGSCRTEKGIWTHQGSANHVSVGETESSSAQTQARSYAEATTTKISKPICHRRNRLDGSLLGRRSGLGLLHSGRRSDSVRGRQIRGSNHGLQKQ